MTYVVLVVAFLVVPALTLGLVGYPLARMARAGDRAALLRDLARELDAGTLSRTELALLAPSGRDRCAELPADLSSRPW